jgi:phage terminase large subunit-like protein
MSYVTDRWTANKVNRVWFDDVVVATDYIGPVQGR